MKSFIKWFLLEFTIDFSLVSALSAANVERFSLLWLAIMAIFIASQTISYWHGLNSD